MKKYLYLLLIFHLFSCRPNKDLDTPDGGSLKKYDAESKRTVYTFTDEMPEFPGGNGGLFKFLYENLKFSSYSLESFRLDFIVEEDGSVRDLTVKTRKGEEIDQEIQKIISGMAANMPKWKPGRLKGKIVPIKMTIPFHVRYE